MIADEPAIDVSPTFAQEYVGLLGEFVTQRYDPELACFRPLFSLAPLECLRLVRHQLEDNTGGYTLLGHQQDLLFGRSTFEEYNQCINNLAVCDDRDSERMRDAYLLALFQAFCEGLAGQLRVQPYMPWAWMLELQSCHPVRRRAAPPLAGALARAQQAVTASIRGVDPELTPLKPSKF